MGDERGDDADRRRADVHSSARIGAAAALTLVLVVLLVLDVAVPDYDISPGILLPLLGAILALLGLEASAVWRESNLRYRPLCPDHMAASAPCRGAATSHRRRPGMTLQLRGAPLRRGRSIGAGASGRLGGLIHEYHGAAA